MAACGHYDLHLPFSWDPSPDEWWIVIGWLQRMQEEEELAKGRAEAGVKSNATVITSEVPLDVEEKAREMKENASKQY